MVSLLFSQIRKYFLWLSAISQSINESTFFLSEVESFQLIVIQFVVQVYPKFSKANLSVVNLILKIELLIGWESSSIEVQVQECKKKKKMKNYSTKTTRQSCQTVLKAKLKIHRKRKLIFPHLLWIACQENSNLPERLSRMSASINGNPRAQQVSKDKKESFNFYQNKGHSKLTIWRKKNPNLMMENQHLLL